jgi:hypothetical protein
MPPLLVALLVVLTVAERQFLSHNGWSAVRRTPVEWPSLLSLGRYGDILVAAFVVAGMLVASCGASLLASSAIRQTRTIGTLLIVAGAALALEAFKPDAPGASGTSWHDHLHNDAYPLIPIAAMLAMLVASVGGFDQGLKRTRRWSRVTLSVVVVSVALTFASEIAQLARYFLLGALLLWFELVALDTLTILSDSGRSTS